MKVAEKVIISCAITGSIHTPTMSQYLPITPDEIAAESIAAAEAGAAIIHLHARAPDGRPCQDTAIFKEFLPRIKQSTDAVLNITTGGGLGMTHDERLAPAKWARPEVASMNMGSMNFGIFDLATKYDGWIYEWEKPYLEGTRDLIYPNTFAMIERGMREIGAMGTRFEFECYDLGHLYNLAYFSDRHIVEPPFFIQMVYGIKGGMGVHPENMVHLKSIADKLFGDDYYMSCLAAGRSQVPLATQCAMLGGHVRVGLEDSLYIARGELAHSNADQVRKIRRVLEELGLTIATPAEARQMLKLKGADQVAF